MKKQKQEPLEILAHQLLEIAKEYKEVSWSVESLEARRKLKYATNMMGYLVRLTDEIIVLIKNSPQKTLT